jgi:MFS family permease
MILFVGGGAHYAIGLSFRPMVTEFGWERAKLGLAVGAYLVVSALTTYLAGYLADRMNRACS